MSEICPVCNGLYDKQMICPKCGMIMEQAGKLEDYSGPYSPYVGKDTLILNNETATTGDNCCIHLYTCPGCNSLEHGSIPLVNM